MHKVEPVASGSFVTQNYISFIVLEYQMYVKLTSHILLCQPGGGPDQIMILSLEGYFSLIEVAWLSSNKDLAFLLLSY